MLALALLALAAAVTRSGGTERSAVLAAVALSAAAGTTLPDLDQILPLGGHRSALSHSLLPALAALRPRWRALAAGLAFGLALHLSADLFPRAMRGYATVKLFGDSLSPKTSLAWLALNASAGFVLAAALARQLVPERSARAALGSLAVLASVLYLATVDGGWWALLVLGGAVWLVRRPR